MLYDLTSLQRDANTRYGFSADARSARRSAVRGAQGADLPADHSRYLTEDMVAEIKPTAELVGAHKEYAKAAAYVTGLDLLPLGRVVNDAKVTDHHAIIPTTTQHPSSGWARTTGGSTTWSPGASWRCSTPRRCSRTRASRRPCPTEDGAVRFRTRGRLLLVPGWRGVYGERGQRQAGGDGDEDEGADQLLPKLEQGEQVAAQRGRRASARKPNRRALQRRLAAGGDGDGRQAGRRRRAARGDEGLGHRHARDARGDHRAADRRSAISSATAARWWPPRRAAA